MLRIRAEESPEVLTLRLEGKLVSPWVEELVRCWRMELERLPVRRQVRINLDAVSFVDGHGVTALTALHLNGCELRGSGVFIAAVLEEITTQRRNLRA